MAGSAETRSPGRFRWVPELLVLVLLLGAVASWRLDLGERWFGWEPIDPSKDPAKVLPPVGLNLAAQGVAAPVASEGAPGTLDPEKVAAAVAPYLKDPKLGPEVDVAVAQLSDGQVVFTHGADGFTPASTTKLVTSAAALEVLGPLTRFRTTVRQVPQTDQITLVGGGDPLLASDAKAAKGLYPKRATMADLAGRTAAALRASGTTSVRVTYDDTLFTGPRVNPAWPATYIPEGVVPPITALWVNEGHNPERHGFVSDPSRQAADLFVGMLRSSGIRVPAGAAPGKAPATSTEIAAVASPTLGELVERTLLVSDNNAAEVIGHQVGVAERQTGSFEAGAAATLDVLGRMGVPVTGSTLYDGSGLSRQNRLTTETLIGLLRVAAEKRELGDLLAGLPVAGFTGSLAHRFDKGAPAGRGRVRAKTGTLTGVHGLAGVITDVQGNTMVFVAIADKVAETDQLDARVAIDNLAAALGACSCSAAPAG